jgi:hypothetical protein
MKTKEQLQAAVDELRKVCERHEVILFGTCESEGIYGEIAISENIETATNWVDIESVLDNKVIKIGSDSFALGGIGDLRSNKESETNNGS